jgi:hypothetical protein
MSKLIVSAMMDFFSGKLYGWQVEDRMVWEFDMLGFEGIFKGKCTFQSLKVYMHVVSSTSTQ